VRLRPQYVETSQFDLRVWAAADDTTEAFAEFWLGPLNDKDATHRRLDPNHSPPRAIRTKIKRSPCTHCQNCESTRRPRRPLVPRLGCDRMSGSGPPKGAGRDARRRTDPETSPSIPLKRQPPMRSRNSSMTAIEGSAAISGDF